MLRLSRLKIIILVMQSTETTINPRLWTVEEYHRMAEAGIFDEDELELLEGNII